MDYFVQQAEFEEIPLPHCLTGVHQLSKCFSSEIFSI